MSFASALTRQPLPFDPARGADVAARYGAFPPEVRALIAGTAGCSPFLAGLLEREQAWLEAALSGDVLVAFNAEIARLATVELDALGAELRRAKRRVAVLTALCDLGGVWELERVTWALTVLADTAVDLALRRLVAEEIRRGKLPGKGPDDAAQAGAL